MPKAKTRAEKRREDGLCTLYVRIPPELDKKITQIVAKGMAAGVLKTRQEAVIKILREARV